jgi:O-antigen ligase
MRTARETSGAGPAQDFGGRVAVLAVGAYPALVWLPTAMDWALYLLAMLGLATAWLREPLPSRYAWPLPELALLIYLAVSLAGIALSADPFRSLTLSSALLPAAMLYWLVTRQLRDAAQLRQLAALLLLPVCGLSLRVLWVSGGTHDSLALVERAASPILVVPNDILWLLLLAPLPVAAALSARCRPARWLWQGAVAVALLLLLAAMSALQSRSAMIVALAGSFAYAWAFYRWSPGKRHGHAPRLTLLAFGLLLSAVAVDALLGFPMAGKWSSLCFSRAPLWSAAWQLFLEQPWIGHGTHSFVEVYQARLPTEPAAFCSAIDPRLTPWPHNLFLELLSTQGLLGTAPVVAVLFWAFRTTLRAGERASDGWRRHLAAALLACWTMFFIAALLELSTLRLWVVTTAALLIGLTLALRYATACAPGQSPPANAMSQAARGTAADDGCPSDAKNGRFRCNTAIPQDGSEWAWMDRLENSGWCSSIQSTARATSGR